MRVDPSGDTVACRPHGPLERLSIEVTNRCAKGCSFCYASSHPKGDTKWTADSLVSFVLDCASRGVRAVSFGGGEPLQFSALAEVLRRLDGALVRSFTTNGLLLERRWDEVLHARPDKVHVSIHAPDDAAEVERVIRQVVDLSRAGVASGVNLLVRRSGLVAARAATQRIDEAGIDSSRRILLPMRGTDTPSPTDVAWVAAGKPFQSMTCLPACAASPRFAAVAWDQTVAWCSYTSERRPLARLDHVGLLQALDGTGLRRCGGA